MFAVKSLINNKQRRYNVSCRLKQCNQRRLTNDVETLIGSIFSTIMERPPLRFWDQVRIIVWFIIVVLVFIFCLAVINGHGCGYKNSFIAHGILGVVVGGCLIILLPAFIIIEKCIGFIARNRMVKKR